MADYYGTDPYDDYVFDTSDQPVRPTDLPLYDFNSFVTSHTEEPTRSTFIDSNEQPGPSRRPNTGGNFPGFPQVFAPREEHYIAVNQAGGGDEVRADLEDSSFYDDYSIELQENSSPSYDDYSIELEEDSPPSYNDYSVQLEEASSPFYDDYSIELEEDSCTFDDAGFIIQRMPEYLPANPLPNCRSEPPSGHANTIPINNSVNGVRWVTPQVQWEYDGLGADDIPTRSYGVRSPSETNNVSSNGPREAQAPLRLLRTPPSTPAPIQLLRNPQAGSPSPQLLRSQPSVAIHNPQPVRLLRSQPAISAQSSPPSAPAPVQLLRTPQTNSSPLQLLRSQPAIAAHNFQPIQLLRSQPVAASQNPPPIRLLRTQPAAVSHDNPPPLRLLRIPPRTPYQSEPVQLLRPVVPPHNINQAPVEPPRRKYTLLRIPPTSIPEAVHAPASSELTPPPIEEQPKVILLKSLPVGPTSTVIEEEEPAPSIVVEDTATQDMSLITRSGRILPPATQTASRPPQHDLK